MSLPIFQWGVLVLPHSSSWLTPLKSSPRQSQRGSFVSHFLALLAMLGVGGSSLSDPFSPGLAGGRAQRMCMVSLVPLTWTLPRMPYTVDAATAPRRTRTVLAHQTCCTTATQSSLLRCVAPQNGARKPLTQSTGRKRNESETLSDNRCFASA